MAPFQQFQLRASLECITRGFSTRWISRVIRTETCPNPCSIAVAVDVPVQSCRKSQRDGVQQKAERRGGQGIFGGRPGSRASRLIGKELQHRALGTFGFPSEIGLLSTLRNIPINDLPNLFELLCKHPTKGSEAHLDFREPLLMF